jgi:hypothetical protein
MSFQEGIEFCLSLLELEKLLGFWKNNINDKRTFDMVMLKISMLSTLINNDVLHRVYAIVNKILHANEFSPVNMPDDTAQALIVLIDYLKSIDLNDHIISTIIAQIRREIPYESQKRVIIANLNTLKTTTESREDKPQVDNIFELLNTLSNKAVDKVFDTYDNSSNQKDANIDNVLHSLRDKAPIIDKSNISDSLNNLMSNFTDLINVCTDTIMTTIDKYNLFIQVLKDENIVKHIYDPERVQAVNNILKKYNIKFEFGKHTHSPDEILQILDTFSTKYDKHHLEELIDDLKNVYKDIEEPKLQELLKVIP